MESEELRKLRESKALKAVRTREKKHGKRRQYMKTNTISLEHGAGGEVMQALIGEIILKNFRNRSAGSIDLIASMTGLLSDLRTLTLPPNLC